MLLECPDIFFANLGKFYANSFYKTKHRSHWRTLKKGCQLRSVKFAIRILDLKLSLFSALQTFMQLVSVNWQTVNTLLCVWHYFLTCYLKLVLSSFQGVKRVTINVIKIPYTSYPTSFSWVSMPGDWSFINCTSPPGCINTAGLEGGWYSGLAELTLSSSLFSSAAPSSSSAPSVITVWRTEQQAQNMNSPKKIAICFNLSAKNLLVRDEDMPEVYFIFITCLLENVVILSKENQC